MNDVLKVLIFSVSAYVYLFIISKILGKKQIAQLTFIDYVVGISIGSIAADMATETEQPFYHFLMAMGVFFLLDLAITFLGRKGAFMKKAVTGKPLIIINDGQVDYEVLKKSKITVDELAGLARDKSYFDLNDIAYAILETSGSLSILPKAAKQPIVAENMDIKLPAPSLSEYLVTDGNICKDTLQNMGFDEQWLLKRLDKNDKEELKGLLWVQYDKKNDKITTQAKVAVG